MTTDDRLEWRISSYSSNGESCVQVAPSAGWRDSAADSDDRASDASEPHVVYVRHSKRPEAGVIEFSSTSWMVFLDEVRAGAGSRNDSARVTFDGTDTLVEAPGTGVRLQFDEGEWTAFLAAIENGEFDTVRFGR